MKTLLRKCLTVLPLAFWAAAAPGEMVTRRWGTPPTGAPTARRAAVPRAEPPTAYVAETKTAPKLDGKLDDAAWKDARTLHLARTLDGSGRAAQPTRVKLLLDRKAKMLYVGVEAFEPLMSKLQVSRRGHDGPVWSDDSMDIFIGLGGTYYQFAINAVGSTYDARAKDASWNSRFKAAAGRDKTHWRLEVAIPLGRMARGEKLPAEWTANFNRARRVTGSLEESSWSPTYSGDSHVPSRFGKMLFKPPPKPQPRKEPEKPVVRGKALAILPAANGAGVVRFDLSALPKGAKIYRADLLIFRTVRVDGRMDEAMEPVEVYPLFSTFTAGAAARPAGKPLPVRGPWHDRLDATDAVAKWVSGKTNGGFFVKNCPFWRAGSTCLDVAYEGKPAKLPRQVTEVKAIHRAGQTFITWKEIADPVRRDEMKWGALKVILEGLDRDGRLRYCVYRHDKKITAANIHQAELLTRVKPLSCWNVNGRSLDRPIDEYIDTQEVLMTGQWNPFWQARQDGRYGRDCPIDRLVIQDGKDALPRATGLYVHTAGKAGKEAPAARSVAARSLAYYAVVSCLDGVQNARDISEANSLARPVTETAGVGQPVLQREMPKMPFFNYKQKRLHYVRWVGPPYVNVPSQYYNWSVGIPSGLGKNVPLELNLHRDGRSYWRTHYRIERDSIVLAPHDFPIKSWWYGYHECYGTLRPFKDGAIEPYTERRLIAFVEWAAKKWPVDRDRILVTGCRGGAGGSGALHLGLRHPGVFSMVIAGHPMVEYAGAAQATGRGQLATAQSMQAIWGKVQWNLQAREGGELVPFWKARDMLDLVKSLSASADLPMVTMTFNHGNPIYRKFADAMLTRRRAIVASFSWGGARYIPISMTGTYPNVVRLDIRRNKSLLAFTSPEGAKFVDKGGMGQFNRQFRWRDVADMPERYEVTIFMSGRGDGAADVTLRRLQKFKAAKGKAYAWKNTLIGPPPTRRGRQKRVWPQSGDGTVGEDGLLTLEGVWFTGQGSRLVITAK